MAGVQAARLNIEIVAEIARLQSDLDKAKRAVNAASKDIAASAKAANDNLAGMGRGIEKAGSTSRLAGHHVQNLAFQFQDLGVQLASGANPLTAFVQQGSQIGGVMMQAGIGVRGLIAELIALAAPFAPIIAAVGLFAAGVGLVTAEINKNSTVTVTWKDTLLGAFDMTREYLTGALTQAFQAFGITTADVWADVMSAAKTAANFIIGVMTLVPRTAIAAFKVMPAAIADLFYSMVNNSIRAIDSLVERAVSAVNSFASLVNPLLEKVGLGIPKLVAPQISEIENNYAGAAQAAVSTFAKVATDTWNRDYIGDVAKALSPFAQERARQRMAEDAEKAGKAAGSKMGKAAGAKAAEETAKTFSEGMDGLIKTIAQWDKEFAKTAEDMIKAAGEAIDSTIAGWADDAAEKQRLWNEEIERTIGLLNSMGGVGKGLGAALGIITGNTQGIGGSLGALLNMRLVDGEGNPLTGKDKTGKEFARTIGTEMREIFNANGPFASMLTSALQGAGVGSALGQVIGGKTGSQIGAAIGAVAGQEFMAAASGPLALASEANRLIGKVFGFKGGPLGVFTSLFTSVKWGRVNLSSQGVSATQGNSGASERAAAKAGGSFYSGLSNIADQFGGALGDFGSISLGVRHGDWRVNAGGTSLKKKNGAMDFNDDAEAAIAYALKLAIERGAITGIRESTQRLLKTGDDLQAQLDKALQFENVFNSLQQRNHPLRFAMDQIEREFDRLRDIFKEAGATAQEYAQLERLATLRRREAREEARLDLVSRTREAFDYRIRILELTGQERRALVASRTAELAGMKRPQQRLQSIIYGLEDAVDVIEKFQPLVDSLRAYRRELRGTEGSGSSNFLTAEFRRTARLAANGNEAALADLPRTAGAFLDAAKENAASALDYQRAVGEVMAAVDKGIFAADAQVDYAQAQIDAVKQNGTLLEQMRSEMATLQGQIVANTGTVARLWQRIEGDGLRVVTDADAPIQVEVV